MNRIKQYINEIIQDELADCSFENMHGLNTANIQEHLIDPVLQVYEDSFSEANIQLWTVLYEVPNSTDGYIVVYDPSKNEFGLAVQSRKSGKKVFIGYYGTFIESMVGM